MHEALHRVSKTAFQTLFWCLVLGVLLQNLVLLRQNRTMRAQANAAAPGIRVGQRLRNLAGVTLDGELRPIAMPTAEPGRLLIITFSPGCPSCQANQTGWASLAAELRRRGGWRVLWVSRDPVALTRDYCRQKQIPLAETLADPPCRTYFQLGLQSVPNTIVCSPGGVVQKVWTGLLNPTGWKDVFAYFNVREPGAPYAPPNRTSAFGFQPGTCEPSAEPCSAVLAELEKRRHSDVETNR